MTKKHWLFRKLNLSLRVEIMINISLLMLVAILLIGFSISKVNEKNIIEERIRNGEGMIQDIQSMIEFISSEESEFSLSDPTTKKAIEDFVRIYTKNKVFYDLMVLDAGMKVIIAKKPDSIGKPYTNEWMRKSIVFGQLLTEIETSGVVFVHYKKLILRAPLLIRGRIAGGIQMEVPIGDVMDHLLKSQRMVLITIILDALLLIAFGSFLLSRVLVKPLKDLVQLTQKISKGDFSRKIEVTSKNEIGQLISSFNRMIDRLKENQGKLENHLKSLELKNKQLKQAQEELIRTEKLASIGRFAAGVAHEVGNPLGAILGYTSILERDGIDREDSKDYLNRIEKEIERIDRIVRELLDFARPSKFEIGDVDINKVVENTLSLISYQKDFKNIETRLDLGLDLPAVKGDESRLSQVFINIVLNAVDAMPLGGTLRIQTGEYVIDNPLTDLTERINPPRRAGDPVESDYSRLRKGNALPVRLTKFSRGERVIKACISDTGVGIKREDLERIFDPFFTTKSPDKGTGLGLSISLSIVESMGGEMRVESEHGKGSAFEIYFPALQPIATQRFADSGSLSDAG